MKRSLFVTAVSLSILAWSLAAIGFEIPDAAGSKPKVREAKGIDRGGPTTMVFVARDLDTWNAVKQAVGKQQSIPKGMPKGDDLNRLDDIDFQKHMIVAVFWGEMSFAGQGEKCRIEAVTSGKEEVIVDCTATLWGGAVKHAYLAWPYHAKAVPRSDLAVRFKQTTELKADPDRSEKDKTIATLKAGEWKQAARPGK